MAIIDDIDIDCMRLYWYKKKHWLLTINKFVFWINFVWVVLNFSFMIYFMQLCDFACQLNLLLFLLLKFFVEQIFLDIHIFELSLKISKLSCIFILDLLTGVDEKYQLFR